ncbi:MAG: hypothetical protein M3437_10385 [Chloroflexota bacterium]|nr:hypothetical protein [Chloroflexota bacterium]MDQ5866169.1 hypothetical protein [Chloroflexota bacterium]
MGIDASELGRQLAARRQLVEGNCQICGKPFVGTKKRKYCSNACAVAAYEKRQRDMRNHEGSKEGS